MYSYIVMALPYMGSEAVRSTIAVEALRLGATSWAAANDDPAIYFRVLSDNTKEQIHDWLLVALRRSGCLEDIYVAEAN